MSKLFYRKKDNRGVKSIPLIRLSMNDNSKRNKVILLEENSFTLPTELPYSILPGMTFLGWSYTEVGEVIAESTIQVFGQTTLYARYTVEITFDPNSGGGAATVEVAPQSLEYKLPITMESFTAPSGKRFLGWSYSSDGERIKDKKIKLLAPITLYAYWI